MDSSFGRGICVVTVVAMACSLAMADVKSRVRTTADGQQFEMAVLIKGPRTRTEVMGMVAIEQCDLKRTLTLMESSRTYSTAPFDGGNTAPAQAGKGGKVTCTATSTDTGERRDFFGHAARRVKTVVVSRPGPGACNPESIRMETDAWYIDLEVADMCQSEAPAGANPECSDEVVYETTGESPAGYAVYSVLTVYDSKGKKSSTLVTEVLELAIGPLETALFDIPAGYADAANPPAVQAASADIPQGASPGTGAAPLASAPGRSPASTPPPAGKPADMVRIGVPGVENRSGQSAATWALQDALVRKLADSRIEAVPLKSASPAEVEAEAAANGCDYVVHTQLISMGKSSSKVGGMLSRAAGMGTPSEKHEAELEFKLVAPGSAAPVLASKVKGSSGGGLKFSQIVQGGMALSSQLMAFNPMLAGNLFNYFGLMGGYGGGMMFGAYNPGTRMAMHLMREAAQEVGGSASHGEPGFQEEGAEDAALSALDKQAKAVLEKVRKKK